MTIIIIFIILDITLKKTTSYDCNVGHEYPYY